MTADGHNMRLTRLAYTDVRARTGTHTLGAADLFVGANGAGKSTALDSVLLCLLGPTDALGTERVHLASPAGRVELDFGAETIARDLGDCGEGSGTRARDIAARVEAVVGRAPMRHDLRGFAAAPSEARAAMLRAVVGTASDSWTPARAIQEITETMPDVDAQALSDACPARGDIAGWMDGAVVWAERHRTQAQEAERFARAAVKRIVAPGERPKGDAAALRQSLAAIDAADDPAARNRIATEAARARGANAALATAHAQAQAAVDRAAAALEGAREALALSPAPPPLPPEPPPWVDGGQFAALSAAGGALRELQDLSEHTGARCRHCQGDDPMGIAERIDAAWEALSVAETAAAAAQKERDEVNAAQDRHRILAREAAAAAEAHRAAEIVVEAALNRWRDATTALARQDTLRAQPVPDVPAVSPETESERARLRREIQGIDAHAAEMATWRQADARKSETIAAASSARRTVDAVRGLRSRIAAERYQPIRDAADALLSETSAPVRLWLDSEEDWGGIKLPSGAHVHYWDLSEAERSLVGVGLAVGCAAVSGARWRVVLLDGMDAIHPDILPQVLRALTAGAERGDWQFIGAATHAPETPGLTLHVLPAPEGWPTTGGPVGNKRADPSTSLAERLHAHLATLAENERSVALRKCGVSALPGLEVFVAMPPRIHAAVARHVGMIPPSGLREAPP